MTRGGTTLRTPRAFGFFDTSPLQLQESHRDLDLGVVTALD